MSAGSALIFWGVWVYARSIEKKYEFPSSLVMVLLGGILVGIERG